MAAVELQHLLLDKRAAAEPRAESVRRPEATVRDLHAPLGGPLAQKPKPSDLKLDRSRDSLLTAFGKATLDDRYLMPGESYQDMFARVSCAFADGIEHAQRLYDAMSQLWFMPATPVLSNGGVPFTPFTDQLVGSCRDYHAVDGWAHYATRDGHWLWVTRDAPLVTVGGPHTLARRTDAPSDTHRMIAMVFDNCWHTNFVADSNGTMEFQFELAWAASLDKPGELAESLVSEPVVVANGAGRNAPELEKALFRV